ncbi:hypothetical protein JW933_00930 [candidate division FCPU426 bacterium]|nr:hypothetical protein [candidate division FCPU426 bacterium]
MAKVSLLDELLFLFKLKPGWRHPEPVMRKDAVKSLHDQALLRNIIENDPELTVRTAAICNITDATFLLQLATNAQDNRIKRAALASLGPRADQDLLQKLLEPGNNLEIRRMAVQHLQDLQVLAALANGDPDAEIRIEAISRVADDAQLMERIAANDPVKGVRLAAVKRLRGAEAIKKVMAKENETAIIQQVMKIHGQNRELLEELARMPGKTTVQQDAQKALVALKPKKEKPPKVKAAIKIPEDKPLSAMPVNGKCDICLCPLRAGYCHEIDKKRFKGIVEKGFNPWMHDIRLPSGLPLAEMGAALGQSTSQQYHAWKEKVYADSTNWILCSRCYQYARHHLS